MKIFCDTNVLLNVILNESDFESCMLLLSRRKRAANVSKFITSHLSMANIAYIAGKSLGRDRVPNVVLLVSEQLTAISDSRGQEFELARQIKGPDYEDILQYVNAWFEGCDCLVTCNKKDFEKISDPSNVLDGRAPRIVSPIELLELLKMDN